MKLTEFLNLKTNYRSIGIKTVVGSGILLLLVFIKILAFFYIYGSGATPSSIAELWYVDLILDYAPIVLVSGFIIVSMITNYKIQDPITFKTNLITLLILIVLYALKIPLGKLII